IDACPPLVAEHLIAIRRRYPTAHRCHRLGRTLHVDREHTVRAPAHDRGPLALGIKAVLYLDRFSSTSRLTLASAICEQCEVGRVRDDARYVLDRQGRHPGG